MKVLVCGGRAYDDQSYVYRVLDSLNLRPFTEDMIITGAALGADMLAETWAFERQVRYLGIPAPWFTKGKSAGFLRNLRMLEEKPDLVVAFPGGRGTAHMVALAKKAGVEVKEYSMETKSPESLLEYSATL